MQPQQTAKNKLGSANSLRVDVVRPARDVHVRLTEPRQAVEVEWLPFAAELQLPPRRRQRLSGAAFRRPRLLRIVIRRLRRW